MICEREIRDPDSPELVYVFNFSDGKLTEVGCKSPYGGWNTGMKQREYKNVEEEFNRGMELLGIEIMRYNPDFSGLQIV